MSIAYIAFTAVALYLYVRWLMKELRDAPVVDERMPEDNTKEKNGDDEEAEADWRQEDAGAQDEEDHGKEGGGPDDRKGVQG